MENTGISTEDNMRISLREKISYGLGDLASNIVWSAAGGFLTFYYTNVIGIAAAAVGTLMLISRILDGISDVIMGGIVDKTKSRFGKARPWLLWGAGPFALASFLLFSVPRDWGDTSKIIYAFLTYNFMSTIVYTMVNLPYGVMNAMITNNIKDRTQLNIFRMMGALLMMIVANMLVIPLVRLFGGTETEPLGWSLTFLMLGVIGSCLFLLCFFGTKERIQTQVADKDKTQLRKNLPLLFKNKFWVIILMTGLIGQFTFGMSGVNPFYAQYFLGDINMTGTLVMAMFLPMFIGLPISGLIINKYGKRNAAMWGSAIGLLGFIVQAINPYNVMFILAGNFIKGLCMSPMMACGFAMYADVIDYHEWKTGIRSEGVVYSAASFGNKVGAGLGAAALGWALALGGFSSELTAQPPNAMTAILLAFIWIPFAGQILIVVFYSQYKLDKIYPQILTELAERKKNH